MKVLVKSSDRQLASDNEMQAVQSLDSMPEPELDPLIMHLK